jgi:hypothetical protein
LLFYKFNRCRQRAKEILKWAINILSTNTRSIFKLEAWSFNTHNNQCLQSILKLNWVGFLKSERVTSFFCLYCTDWLTCGVVTYRNSLSINIGFFLIWCLEQRPSVLFVHRILSKKFILSIQLLLVWYWNMKIYKITYNNEAFLNGFRWIVHLS